MILLICHLMFNIFQEGASSTTANSVDKTVEYIAKLSDLSELSSAISDLSTVKKELKQFKNFKICEELKKCEDGCSCNADSDCDICKVLDFAKKEKL
nr:unnamed protein product [Callosobruchus chinensis]